MKLIENKTNAGSGSERYMNIDECIAAEMSDRIERRGNSPLPGAVLLVAGGGLIALSYTAGLADSLQTALLTVGVLAAVVGVVLAALCIGRVLWHYRYRPTGSRMRSGKRYLSAAEYAQCTEALRRGDTSVLGQVQVVVSSNAMLRVVTSADGAVALLQVGTLDTSQFEPSTPVVLLEGTETAAVQPLLR